MDLFEYTAQVIDTESFEDAKPIFEMASRQCPELLCIALASLDPTWNSINKEILVKLTCGFLLGQPSSSVVLPRVWALNPNVLLFCMVEMHRRDATCLSRLLDVAQELKILPVILDAKPYSFTLDLACLASRRQHLNIEKWLAEAMKEKGEAFLRAVVEFVSEKVAAQYGRSHGSAASPPGGILVAPEVLTVFVKVLLGAFPGMAPDVAEQFREVHRVLSAELSPIGGGTLNPERVSGSIVDALPEMSFAADVEEEVNSFFDRIFAREISVPEVIEVLRRLKASTSVRSQQVFACFLHNIFDEFRFFAKYPENELNLTAVLFGQLVNCDLVASAVPLQLALRCILEALKKQPSQKLFRFGLQALLQFHGRLVEMPQFCAQLLQTPHLQQVYPDLHNYIRGCMSGQAASSPSGRFADTVPAGGAPVITSGGGLVPPTEPSSSSNASSGSGENPLVEAAEKQKLLVPAEGVRDRILFIMNNLSLGNLEAKANDLVKVLEEAHFAWLAQYLVVRRASLEPNYHGLYLGFLDILQLHPLSQAVLTQTYVSIYVLLRSAKIVGSSAERSLLKNLGSWLGGLTLAHDLPILHRDLSLKDLLIEAVVSDRLIAIVPFVCKVAEQCARSRAFQPENPWLMAILRLLAELYNFADLKLNLKFEIEVLCKNLSIDLHALEPSNLLKPKAVTPTINSRADATVTFPWTESALTHLVVLGNGPLQGSRVSSAFKKLIALAIEYAIRDVALSVAQRSLQYALNTTRAVAGKDFAGEPDSAVYRHAAASMASALTANMAVVLARESLRGSIINNVRVFAQWAGLSHLLGDAIIEGIAEDNTDLASAYIEKTALERSRPQIEQVLASETDIRPRSAAVPKMTVEQARVYEEFVRKARPAHLAALPPVSLEPPTADELERLARALAAVASSNKVASDVRSEHIKNDATATLLSPGVPAVDGSLDAYFESVCLKFVDLVATIERLVPAAALEADAISKLPSSHEIRTLMKQIVMLASSSPIHRDELCLLMSQRLMQGLYKTDAPLYVDIIILLLIKIFEFSSKAAKEVTTWVVHSTDERKYSVLATAALFGSGLIYVLDFDGQLAKQIEHGPPAATTFAVELIRRCVFGEPSVAAPYDFVYSLEALGKLVQENSTENESAARLLHDIAAMVKAPQPESQLLRDQTTFCFTDWFRLCQYPSISEKLISSFVAQLFHRRFLADEAAARPFFQICTELAIELYVRQRRAPAILAYRSIDAFARLVGQIIKFHLGPADGIDALRIVTIVHSVAGLILVQGLGQGLDYLQRPFARLFGSLATEILRSDSSWAVVENLRY
jgi:CCR4-NOT transcription complex subunit 1